MTIAVDWDIKNQTKQTDPGVMSSIPGRPHIFMEIVNHKIISLVIILLPLTLRKVGVSYKHEVLVNHLVKLAQEKSD